jgi:soluble lytic murein transglycosylase-like protein
MHPGYRLIVLTVMAVALAGPPVLAQLDLTPPGAQSPPAARPSRPAAPVVRAPRVAPVPEPRPDEAEAGTTPPPELATTPPTPVPAPSVAAPPAAPDAAASRFDDVFRDAEAASSRAPAIPEGHPAVINAPLPPSRAAVPAASPGTPPAPVDAEASIAAANPPQLEAPFAEAPHRRFEGRAYSDKRYPVGRAAHFELVRRIATELRVPIDLADAVATVESAYDPHAVGLVDEIGLMQVRPSIARQLGFTGTVQDLFEPETNIRLGMTYLAGAWERSGGQLCQALTKYRAGWEETQMSPLSQEYCRRAVVHLNAIGSPLARGVTVAPGPAAPPPGQRSTSQFNWRDHEDRIKQIEQRFGGPNFGIIAREPQRP